MSAFRSSAGARDAQAPPTASVSDFLSTPRSNISTPSTESYAALCKVVLARRIRNMLSLTAAASYAALLVAVFDPRELPGSLVNFLPVLLFAPVAFLGTLPLFVLRKRTISLPRPPRATRFAQYSQLRERSTLTVFLTYLSGAAMFHLAYVWCTGYTSKNPNLGFTFYHQGRDTWQVNERRITLALFHAFLAAFATVHHVVEERSQVVFDDDASLAIPVRLGRKAIARLRSVVRTSGIAFVAFWSCYVVLRRPILRFILVHFAGSWARPHLYTLMRHSGAYSFTLALRAVATSFLFSAMWEATHVIFEVYTTQPMSVSQFGSNPNQSLLSGLRSKEPYFQQFAFLEFQLLTLTSKDRRESIFKDVKRSSGGSGGGAWSELSRECLVLIGTELQRAKGRGRLPVTVTGFDSTRPSSSSSSNEPNQKPSNVKTGDEIFVPTRSTLFDELASTASNSSPSANVPSLSAAASTVLGSKATSAISSAVSNAQTTLVSRVPSILQTGAASDDGRGGRESAPASAPTMQAEDVPQVVGSEGRIAKWVPGPLRETLFGISPEYTVTRCLPRVGETVCAIQALSNLTCASLKEDPYGVAQRDIPKILEGFVRYLTVLDGLEKEFDISASRSRERDGGERAERWSEIERKTVGVVQDALRHGARAILTEFSPYLSEFRFPTQIASQLQLLVDWGA
ncbi:hypothetical protein JCM11491_001745 [Sporobolomyces phaffii]